MPYERVEERVIGRSALLWIPFVGKTVLQDGRRGGMKFNIFYSTSFYHLSRRHNEHVFSAEVAGGTVSENVVELRV